MVYGAMQRAGSLQALGWLPSRAQARNQYWVPLITPSNESSQTQSDWILIGVNPCPFVAALFCLRPA